MSPQGITIDNKKVRKDFFVERRDNGSEDGSETRIRSLIQFEQCEDASRKAKQYCRISYKAEEPAIVSRESFDTEQIPGGDPQQHVQYDVYGNKDPLFRLSCDLHLLDLIPDKSVHSVSPFSGIPRNPCR